jgi:NAD(P)-dependent dehydrogenase (short-subunit alcohol dehydrogenase family)
MNGTTRTAAYCRTVPGKVVLVTGCSSGIGRATALSLGARRDRVYATMRTPSDLAGAQVLQLDVTDQASVQGAVDTVLEREGRIDVVVNNAGIGAFGPLERSSDDDWLVTFETNLFGPVRLARAALPAMRAQGEGVIVNISSVAGRVAAIPMQSAYSASKHGLCVLTDALNAECGAFGIRAVCIEPGFTATSIMEKHRVSLLEDDDPYKPALDNIEQFFRAGLAAAAPPDVVAAMIAQAIDGTLTGGTHFPVNVPGFTPTTDTARGSAP